MKNQIQKTILCLFLAIIIKTQVSQDSTKPVIDEDLKTRTKTDSSIKFPTSLTSNIKSNPTKLVSSRRYNCR